jgi:hypothetical protein
LFHAEANELVAAIKVVKANPLGDLPRPVFSAVVDGKGNLDIKKANEPPKVSIPACRPHEGTANVCPNDTRYAFVCAGGGAHPRGA